MDLAHWSVALLGGLSGAVLVKALRRAKSRDILGTKTIRDFQAAFVVAPLADGWALVNHFGLTFIEPDGSRQYQRWWMGRKQMVCVVRQAGLYVRLETCIHTPLLVRFFVSRPDTSVESGTHADARPKKLCRDAVNVLLAQLGQPPIP